MFEQRDVRTRALFEASFFTCRVGEKKRIDSVWCHYLAWLNFMLSSELGRLTFSSPTLMAVILHLDTTHSSFAVSSLKAS